MAGSKRGCRQVYNYNKRKWIVKLRAQSTMAGVFQVLYLIN